jgi:hypothetical protein
MVLLYLFRQLMKLYSEPTGTFHTVSLRYSEPVGVTRSFASRTGGEDIKRAEAVRHRSFQLSSPNSSAVLGITQLGSFILGALAQEVMMAATLSVLR